MNLQSIYMCRCTIEIYSGHHSVTKVDTKVWCDSHNASEQPTFKFATSFFFRYLLQKNKYVCVCVYNEW